MAEGGIPNFEATEWFGIVAPAGTPADIVAKINAAVVKVMQSPDLRARLVQQFGFSMEPNTPSDFASFMISERDKWTKVVKDARITPE